MSEEQRIQEISLDLIDLADIQVRAYIDEGELEKLAESIQMVGQITPIKVRKIGERYIIVDGVMRFLASKRLGKTTIRAIVEGEMAEDRELAERLHANIRVEQDPLGEALFFNQVMEKLNLTPSLLAPIVKRSEQYIRERLDLLRYPVEIQEALKEKQISLGVARWLALIDNEVVRKDYLHFAKTGGLSVEQAKKWYQSYKQSKEEAPPSAKQLAEETKKQEPLPPKRECPLCGGHIELKDLAVTDVHRDCLNLLREKMAEQGYTEVSPKPESPSEGQIEASESELKEGGVPKEVTTE